MYFPKTHIKLREIVDPLLGSNELIGRLWKVKHITAAVNNAAKISADSSLVLTDEELAAAYHVVKDEPFTCAVKNSTHVILATKTRDGPNGKRETYVGRFESKELTEDAKINHNPPRNVAIMSVEEKDALNAFLKKRQKKKEQREKANNNKNKKKKTTNQAKEKAASPIKRKSVTPTDTDDEQQKKKKKKKEEEEREAAMMALKAEKDRLFIKAEKMYEQQQKTEEELAKMRLEVAEIDAKLGEQSTRPSPIKVEEGGRTLYYTLDGRIGRVPYSGGSILPSDIDNNFMPLPEGYGDEEKHNNNRKKRKYEPHALGSSQYWLPPGATSAAKNHHGKKEDAHDTMKDLAALFSGSQSSFNWDSLRYSAAFNVQGYGASDEATEMIITGWTKTLLEELGVTDITAAEIAAGCPSSKSWVRGEEKLAADCLMVVMDEIMEDEAKHFALMLDHGKRAGIEHFVKILIWAGWADKQKTKKMIKFHCLDVDSSFHDAAGCAEAVKKSLEQFSGVADYKVTVTCITGDAGGGGAVQHLLPALIKIGAIDGKSVKINCLMHALNKCIECAGQDTFGQQGMGRRTPFQLLFVFNQLWKVIKEEGGGKAQGKEYLDTIYSLAVNKLMNDPQWQQEATENFPQAYKNFSEELEALEDLDEDSGIDDLVEFVTSTPSNIQDPVFSRWKTVMSTANVVVKYWTQIYVVAVAVMQSQKTDSYLFILSSTLLSLMNERSRNESSTTGTGEDGTDDSEEQYSYDDQVDPKTVSFLQKGDTPTFYAMLLFFCAFGSAYFNDMFHWGMKEDPILGAGSFGQTSRFCVERCYIMHKLLSELENDGWKQRAEFAEYIKVLDGIEEEASADDSKVGRAFFDKAATVFLQRYRFVFEKHVASCWRSDSILHYILGGNPTLANEFARWLVDYTSMQDSTEEDIGDESDDEDAEDGFAFSSKKINMGANHYRFEAQQEVIVDVDDAMEYITGEADRSVIMESEFVKSHWHLIEKMGMCEHEIDLFDKTTWGSDTNGNPYDFEPLHQAIWNEIAIHACHQQRCENWVQLAALVSKTNVSEVRRTLRAIILSAIIRPFHQWAKEYIAERSDKKAPRRVEGAKRGELLIKYMQNFSKKAKKARRSRSEQENKEIIQRLTSKDGKTSSDGRKKKLATFVDGLQKKRKIYKAELPTGVVDQTVVMKGGILFKYLTITRCCTACQSAWKKRKYAKCDKPLCCMAAVHAELDVRNIKLSKKEYKRLNIREKRDKIRKDEAKHWNTGDRAKEGFDIKSMRDFQPKSALMKGLSDMCMAELNKEKGITI